MKNDESLKALTARAVKWNAIDKLSTQLLYAVTGIVLARLLSPDDFGLVGALLVFQAFASLLVDSGFSFALIQRKAPTQTDYSSVLWFNLFVSVTAYLLLFMSAPLIADCFQGDKRLIPLARVLFIGLILNASTIVQVNRYMKQMNVRPVAFANIVSLAAGGVAGIVLAVKGFGAWAIVWQGLVNAGVKALVLWTSSGWLPSLKCSLESLRGFFRIGGSMMLTSFFNTLFQNIYSFFIGNRSGLVQLGYYTQGDKWSKMGIMSISQTLSSAFLPTLSEVQDDEQRFRRICRKMNRMMAYLMFPFLIGLAVTAVPIFHLLFGEKWDLSIPIFVMLLGRGAFTILTNLYTNYILALGRSRVLVILEIVRDSVAFVALVVTLPCLDWDADSIVPTVRGIEILVAGQIVAAFVAWVVTLVYTARITGISIMGMLADNLPYLGLSAVIGFLMYLIGKFPWEPLPVLALQTATGLFLYLACNSLLRSRIQTDALSYITGKLKP